MKVFVATRESQGQRDNDFFWTEEGELVEWAMACDRDDDPDGGCGCQRAMAGLDSSKATTTFAVADLPITKRDYVAAVKESYDRRWRSVGFTRRQCAKVARDLRREAARFAVGAILERRGDVLQQRDETTTL